mmetsp:Transcript_2472/g.3885  ORF Transcript_2472/g.3885 Transcript_2472/m.3885 type:complete len:93 (+) Transcript_2472:51-329(+)
MRKHERAKDAVGFLEKEAEAIKGLVRSYIQREQPPQGEPSQGQGHSASRHASDAGRNTGWTHAKKRRDGGGGDAGDDAAKRRKAVIDFDVDL